MAMDCLVDRIGVQGCGSTTGGSQLTVNSLPGISLEMISALADDEQQTFLGVWRDVALRAVKKFEVFVRQKLNGCYKITDRDAVNCFVCENIELFDVALWYLHGVELMIEVTSTDTMSRFTTIGLEKAEQLKQDFFLEFTASLDDAVNGMDPKASDCFDDACVECNGQIKFVTQLP
jgi:hypothetical protein